MNGILNTPSPLAGERRGDGKNVKSFPREKAGLSLFVIILVILSFPVTALSEPSFLIKPKVSTSWRVDSNYYKTDFEETKVYTYLVRPGFDLGYETAKSLVVFNYTLDAYFYDEKGSTPPGRKSVKDFIGHTLGLEAKTKPTDRLTLGLDESFYKTRNPEQSDAPSNNEVRDKYWINRFSPVVYYDFAPKFTAGARYRRTNIEYTSGRSGQPDSTEDRGIFDLIYSVTPTASLDLNYQHWKMDYDHNDRYDNNRYESDYKSDQIGLVLKKSYKYLSFEAGGGYQKRRFDESDRDDIDTPVFLGVVKGEKGRSHFALHAEQNFNNYYDGDDYYMARRVTLEVGHVFVEKLPVVIRGGYQNSDYEEFRGPSSSSGNLKKRNDDTYGIRGSIGYIFTDWLTATAEAGYDNRNSSLIGYDYDNKFGIVKLDLSYDVGKRRRQ